MAPSFAQQGVQLLRRSLPLRAASTAVRSTKRNASAPDAAIRRATTSPTQAFGSIRTLATTAKRHSQTPTPAAEIQKSTSLQSSSKAKTTAASDNEDVRLPRSVQAIYLRPLKRKATHGLPACDLQMRSYSVRNLEMFADFALRAAYYLKIPASGPVPLPRLIQRWTVSKSPFVHKKTKENFERITLRRLIQIKDADPEVVQIWLAYLRKHAYHGVGMKANIWEHSPIAVGKTMDASTKELQPALDAEWARFGRKKGADPTEKIVEQMRTDS